MRISPIDISTIPGRSAVSFWAYPEPIRHECEAIVVDLRTGDIIGRIPGHVIASQIDWNDTGYGVFSLTRTPGDTARIKVVEPRGFCIEKSFGLERNVLQAKWISPVEVAFITLSGDIPSTGPPAYECDIGLLDTSTAAVRMVTSCHDVQPPLQVVSGELWYVRAGEGYTEVHSLRSQRSVWCAPKGSYLGDVVQISNSGSVLALKTDPRIISLIVKMLRYPCRLGRIIPAVREGWLKPMGASVVDGNSGTVSWSSPPGEVLTGAIGDGGKVALSLRLSARRYGLAEYDMPRGSEHIIACGGVPINVATWADDGWIATQDDRAVVLLRRGNMDQVFP